MRVKYIRPRIEMAYRPVKFRGDVKAYSRAVKLRRKRMRDDEDRRKIFEREQMLFRAQLPWWLRV